MACTLPLNANLSPESDVCQFCQDFRFSCMNHVKEDDADNPNPACQAALDAFRQHLQKAKDERDFYRHGCLFTQHFLEKLGITSLRILGTPKRIFCCIDATAHLSFDYCSANSQFLSSSSQQVGPICFKTGLKAAIFGVTSESMAQGR